jgi:hypothetical protein
VRRPAHRLVGAILAQMNADLLRECRCWFGGGTRIVLDLDEYRVSADLDFMVSDPHGYAEVRALVRQRGPAVLFAPGASVRFPREPSTDQYGVRFPVECVGEDLVKLEIVREARIPLGDGERPAWSSVGCLARSDAVAEKLLTNSDRWLDASVLSRDILDLAAARVGWGPLPPPAVQKAIGAYGPSVTSDLARAAARFLEPERAPYRERCFTGLAVDTPDRLLDGVRTLTSEFGTT